MTEMKDSFCGVSKLIQKHTQQISQWDKLLKDGQIRSLHDDHFDWWAFPTDERSSYGELFTLTKYAIQQLLSNETFVANFRRGVILASNSWGWDVLKSEEMPTKLSSTLRPVRLYKMGLSCLILKQKDLYQGLRNLAHFLHSRKFSLSFHSSHTGKLEDVLVSWDRRKDLV